MWRMAVGRSLLCSHAGSRVVDVLLALVVCSSLPAVRLRFCGCDGEDLVVEGATLGDFEAVGAVELNTTQGDCPASYVDRGGFSFSPCLASSSLHRMLKKLMFVQIRRVEGGRNERFSEQRAQDAGGGNGVTCAVRTAVLVQG